MRFGSRSRLLAAAVVVVLGLGALVLGRRPTASPASSNRQAATASRLDPTGAPAGLDGDDAATIAGSVRHADGTPAPGAHVMLVRARAELAAPGAFFNPPMAVRDTSA